MVLGALAGAVHGQFMGNNIMDVMLPFPDGVIPYMEFPSEWSTIHLNITKGLGWCFVLNEILLM
jgi:hypothetical protein